ncbi:hypothetical protein AAMO2058_001660900 [Amorphochlora amoebiformis]
MFSRLNGYLAGRAVEPEETNFGYLSYWFRGRDDGIGRDMLVLNLIRRRKRGLKHGKRFGTALAGDIRVRDPGCNRMFGELLSAQDWKFEGESLAARSRFDNYLHCLYVDDVGHDMANAVASHHQTGDRNRKVG